MDTSVALSTADLVCVMVTRINAVLLKETNNAGNYNAIIAEITISKIERFSIAYRKTKNQSNYSDQSQKTQTT